MTFATGSKVGIGTNADGTPGYVGFVARDDGDTVHVELAHAGVKAYPSDQVRPVRFDRSIGEWGGFVWEVAADE